MDVEKVLVVYSGHNSSTFDVSKYIVNGFRSIGIDARPCRYDQELVVASGAVDKWAETHEDYVRKEGDVVYIASKAVLADVVTYMPDLVLVVTGLMLFGSLWDWLRELQERLRRPYVIGLLLTESPYRVEEELQAASMANIVWTSERAFVKRLRHLNPRSFWLPHAYDEGVHYPAWAEQTAHDVYFCGSGQPTRMKLLGETDWSGINFRLEGYFTHLLDEYSSLEPYYREGIRNNAEVADQYRRAAICLNIHRKEARRMDFRIDLPYRQTTGFSPYLISDGDAWSLNNRAIEIAACGSLQLCDSGREELRELFGDSVPTYESPEELRDKVLYYLDHESERKRLAEQALLCVQNRTYRHSAFRIVDNMTEAF